VPPTAQDTGNADQSVLGHYDGYDRQASERYFEIVASARQHCPVARSAAHGGYWIVSSHSDIRRILSDPETFSNANGIMIPVEDRLRKPPQDLDPPLQTDFRPTSAACSTATSHVAGWPRTPSEAASSRPPR
jgi:cytochrome P450